MASYHNPTEKKLKTGKPENETRYSVDTTQGCLTKRNETDEQ